jgi:hypothetical protein
LPGPVSLPVTRTNVTSTAETDTSVFTVPANTWADGQVLDIEEVFFALNNTGGNVAWTRKVYVGATAITLLSAVSKSTSAAPVNASADIRMLRVGADVYYRTLRAGSNTEMDSGAALNLGASSTRGWVLLASGVTFTSDVTCKMTMQLATYDASTSYYDTVGASAELK